MRGIREIEKDIDKLSGYYELCNNQRVKYLIQKIKSENGPKLRELQAELEAVKGGRAKPTPRWPSDVPEAVFVICEDYWKGSEEHAVYRIHCWNDKAVWTSYPARAWYCQGVRNQGKASYYLLSLTEKNYSKPYIIKLLDGRVSASSMKAELNKLV